jgi:hypothetical protein
MGSRMIHAAVVFAALGAVGLSASAQAPSQGQEKPEQTAQKAKKTKVWTDDNIDSLRSPSDTYQMQEEQERNAQKTAKQAASTGTTSVPAGSQPKTVQQADSMIAEKQTLLASQKDYLQRLQKQVSDPETKGLEKTRLEWRLKSYTATTQHTQADLAQLQAEKDALAKKAAAEKGTDGSGATPQQ